MADDKTQPGGGSEPCGCPRCPRRGAPRANLHAHDWLADIPGAMAGSDLVEVQFKNTRKGYYRNTAGLDLTAGDMVAVEATPGHDIGRVSMTGPLVLVQMKRAGIRKLDELKRVFRHARPADLDKYEEARAKENDTMIRSRRIAEDLKLNMKIGDVEYQGDGNKAIFYYIADERVDFRQLIKVLADTFHIRIEMKQIGARQEAGRIGGIGPCGRPLCCATWMTNFVTVGTAAARFQDISLNPQKLAGQCAKLKCCLNYEVDSYVESLKQLPGKEVRLETKDNVYYHFKYDIFGGTITYSTDKHIPANLVTIDAARAFEIIELNKRGEKPDALQREGEAKDDPASKYNDILSQDISRFDNKKKRKRTKGDKPEKGDKAEKLDKQPKQPKAEKADKSDKAAKPDKPDNSDKQPKTDKPERQPKQGKQRSKADVLAGMREAAARKNAPAQTDAPAQAEPQPGAPAGEGEPRKKRSRGRRGGRGRNGRESSGPESET